jgi:hypothetical protein
MEEKTKESIKFTKDSNGTIWFHIISVASFYEINKMRNYTSNTIFKNEDINFIDTHTSEYKIFTRVHLKSSKSVDLRNDMGEQFIKMFRMVNCCVEVEEEKK